MRRIDNEKVTFESIDDHIARFDWPDELSFHFEPCDREHLASAFKLSRPILLAMIATPLIPEKWQAAIDVLLVALNGVVGEGVGRERELPVC